MTLSCTIRYNKSVTAQELVPEELPTRMLGWEQMILMFSHKPSSENDDNQKYSKETHAFGLTERGTVCSFKFKLGASFQPGAGIAPTHGGFLMCGRNADSNSDEHNYFSCCYWANKRYSIHNTTCMTIPSYFDQMYNDAEWNGKLILGTDNVLEQYQNSMYAFFQGSGEIYVGGIVWSNDARWIINWVKINEKGMDLDSNPDWPKENPCLAVVGTDLFVVGGTAKDGHMTSKTYGYRLNKTGTWFEVKDYLTSQRSGATCLVDKLTKDVFTIGGNQGKQPTIEIGRYQSHIESTQDRFIGFRVTPDNCDPIDDKRKECWHLKLKENFQNGSRLNAFQLDNDDGQGYKTLIVGRSAYETTVMEFNKTTNITTKFLMTSRIHMDSEKPYPIKLPDGWEENDWDSLKELGEDTFYAVPMKTIGFRPCSQKVPFIKRGKMILSEPKDEEYYEGYWWNENESKQVHEQPEKDANGEYKEGYEYYYYLSENYHDN